MWWWCVAIASGEPPATAEADGEILVIGERRLAETRRQLAQQLQGKGYLKIWSVGDRTWYLHPKLWKPGVVVHDEGFARIRVRRLIPLPEPPIEGMGGEGDSGPTVVVQSRFLVQPQRQIQQQRTRLAQDLEPHLREIRAATWQLAQRQRELDLRDALAGIWIDGIDRHGATMPTYRARRAALAARWLHTADGEAGRWARGLIGAFIDDEVQASDHPFTQREIATTQEDNPHPQPFLPITR